MPFKLCCVGNFEVKMQNASCVAPLCNGFHLNGYCMKSVEFEVKVVKSYHTFLEGNVSNMINNILFVTLKLTSKHFSFVFYPSLPQ